MSDKDLSLDEKNNTPLLSIAIPTKNRYETLIPVLEALLENIVDDDYEIVIQDNSDNNESIEEWLKVSNDNRVNYYFRKESLSQSENSNLAIGNCQGEYIIFIGDDDFVSPYICDIVKKMKHKQIYCLIYTPGNYYWKEVNFAKKSYLHQNQVLYLPRKISSNLIKKVSVIELKKVLDQGVVSMLGLPKIYHGIVKKSILDQVKEKWGSYIPGASPDMASAVALSLVIDYCNYISHPVSITGVSVKSTAGLGAKNAHIGKLEEQKFLPKNIADTWDKNIPRIWTGSSIYAQSAFEVLGKCSLYKINYFALYAHMYTYHANLKSHIDSAKKHIKLPLVIKNFIIIYYMLAIFIKRCVGKIKRSFGIYWLRGYGTFDSVDKCMKFLKNIQHKL